VGEGLHIVLTSVTRYDLSQPRSEYAVASDSSSQRRSVVTRTTEQGFVKVGVAWLWHAGPAPLSPDGLWRAYLARFGEEHAFKFAKGHLGLTAARVRTPGQAGRWVRLVMAAYAQLLLARPLTADLRRPWNGAPTPPGPCHPDGSAADFRTSAPSWAPPPVSLNPPGPAPAGPKAPHAARHPAIQSRRKAANRTRKKPKILSDRLKLKVRHERGKGLM